MLNFSGLGHGSKQVPHFYIIVKHCGCGCDQGCLTVSDIGLCELEDFDSSVIMPMFLYSSNTSSTSKYGVQIVKCNEILKYKYLWTVSLNIILITTVYTYLCPSILV